MGIGTIYITSNQSWTITGPAWIPALPLAGAGNYEYTPITSANSTGAYRSDNIVITYQDGTIETVPIVQFESAFVNAKVYVLGLDDDTEQYVKYKISLADGRILTDVNTLCGGEFDFSNYPQAGIMPVNGDTISLITYTDDDYKTFSLNFGNAAYWKSSNVQYNSGEDVIASGATAISLTSVSPNYSGSFVYVQAGTFFYIVLDYRNIISCTSGTKIASTTRSYYPMNIDIDFGNTSAGLASLDYVLTNPYDVSADYNDALILQDEASSIGSVVFTKGSVTDRYVRMVVSNGDNPILGNITINMVCPSLTGFTIATTAYASTVGACADVGATTTMYHDGVNALPDIGDRIYTDILGTITFDGSNSYYKVGTDAYFIDTTGLTGTITTCICSEVAIPVIATAGNIYFQTEQPLSVRLTATNNPTAWSFYSIYNEYIISGNTRGGTYTYIDINGCSQSASIGVKETQVIIGNTVVISAFGDATVSSAGAMYYPRNIFIDNTGEIGGIFNTSGTYSYDVIATNCFGNSIVKTITFVVKHAPTLAPFNMVQVGYCSSAEACASTEPYQVLWFDNNPCEATCVYPNVNDFVFIDGYREQYLNGGYLYYPMDNGDWILIDGIGQVIERGTC